MAVHGTSVQAWKSIGAFLVEVLTHISDIDIVC
jgi:hypothetical protein